MNIDAANGQRWNTDTKNIILKIVIERKDGHKHHTGSQKRNTNTTQRDNHDNSEGIFLIMLIQWPQRRGTGSDGSSGASTSSAWVWRGKGAAASAWQNLKCTTSSTCA